MNPGSATTAAGHDTLLVLPELLLLAGAVLTLVVGMYSPREAQFRARAVAAAGLLAALVAGVAAGVGAGPGSATTAWSGSWSVDTLTTAARVVVPAAALLTLGLSVGSVAGTTRETEFYVLVLLGSLGSVVLAGAEDLLVLAAGYLLASIPLYALAGLARDPSGTEAAMKVYLVGALLGVLMLLGVTVLTGVGGTTAYAGLRGALASPPPSAVAAGLVFVLAGLLFKAGAVPAHAWVPDAAQGSRVGAAAFLTTVPKIGALVATYRVVELVAGTRVPATLVVAVLAAASMTLGTLAAFGQTSVRRLLGWSTVAQAGYLLMAVAATGSALSRAGLGYYLAGYAVTNLAAFAVLAALPRAATLADARGLARVHPLLAVALTVAVLGLVGIPPTAVFIGKLGLFGAAWDAGLGWLTVIGAVNTVASLWWALRWLAPALLSWSPDGGEPDGGEPDGGASDGDDNRLAVSGRWAAGCALGAAAASLALGVAAGPVLAALGGGLSP